TGGSRRLFGDGLREFRARSGQSGQQEASPGTVGSVTGDSTCAPQSGSRGTQRTTGNGKDISVLRLVSRANGRSSHCNTTSVDCASSSSTNQSTKLGRRGEIRVL